MPEAEPEPLPDPGLAHAYALISVFSEVVVRIMAEEFGRASTANRTIQALMVVAGEPGIMPSVVSERTGMTRSATARAIAHLLHEGLVLRVPDPRDRRSARLHPTDRAQARFESFEGQFRDYLVATADASREVVDLLGPHVAGPARPPGARPADMVGRAMDVLTGMTAVGASFVDRVRIFMGAYGLERGVDRAALALALDRGGVRPSELATALRLSSGGATQVLDRLEGAGLVRRVHPAGEDGRIVRASCTPRGTEAMGLILDVLRGQAAEMSAVFQSAVGFAESQVAMGRSGQA